MSEYVVIEAASVVKLSEFANKRMNLGYAPVGAPFVIDGWWYQCMTRKGATPQ